MNNQPAFAYFLTFRTYGTWLHGDERGSVSRKNHQYGTPVITPHIHLSENMQSLMNDSTLQFTSTQQKTVLQSMIETCQYNHWTLYAAHVRIEHVHVVLQSSASKEKTQTILKCYATKALKKNHVELSKRQRFWARHGSTKNIWAPESLFPALYYVVREQGDPMALYYDKKFYSNIDEQLYEIYS